MERRNEKKIDLRRYLASGLHDNETVEDIESKVAGITPSIKGTMGIINEAAHFTMLQAIDEVKNAKRYKFMAKALCKQVIKEYDDYKKDLQHPSPGKSQFFNVENLSDKSKSRLKKSVTDEQYFSAWLDIAASAHKGYRPMLEVLRYKYEKALREQGEKDAALYSWLVIASVMMQLAVKTFLDAMEQAVIEAHVKAYIIEKTFQPFCFENVRVAWERAATYIFPRLQNFADSVKDDRNILLGHEQLHQAIAEQYKTMDCFKEGVMDNADLYVNKKALVAEIDGVGVYAEYMKEVEIK